MAVQLLNIKSEYLYIWLCEFGKFTPLRCQINILLGVIQE